MMLFYISHTAYFTNHFPLRLKKTSLREEIAAGNGQSHLIEASYMILAVVGNDH